VVKELKMKTMTPKKTESNTLVIAKPKQRLHWAPKTKVYENKKRKAMLRKFVPCRVFCRVEYSAV
jgi:hypothetical protein